MWAIRILTGPQAGQVFPLKPGKAIVGRAPNCEVKINSNSVSKEHVSLLVTEDKLILSDLNSRNGTYVNGIRIQNQRLNLGDKISLHDVLLDILQVPETVALNQPLIPSVGGYSAAPPAWAGNAALKTQAYETPATYPMNYPESAAAPGVSPQFSADVTPAPAMQANSLMDLVNNFKIYIDNVAMPGIYAVMQPLNFRYAIGALLLIFVLAATILSLVPMMSVTKSAMQLESTRRAKTITRHLAATNRKAIVEKNDLALSTQGAEREEGVKSAVIMSASEGTIMAPTTRRGEIYSKMDFVKEARRDEKETTGFIDSSTLGVAVPISYYNPSTGNQVPVAYAVVVYDMGALALSSAQTLSLILQTLSLSFGVGLIIYFLLYKFVEQPLVVLNTQLDDALREGRDDLKTDFHFPILENLISNINSALSRIGPGGNSNLGFATVINRDVEAANIVRMLPGAAISINAIDDRIIYSNSTFDRLVGGGVNLEGRPLSDIPDSALQNNLSTLLQRMKENQAAIAQDEITFFGSRYEVCGHAVMGASEPAYYLVTLNQLDQEG